MKVPYGAGTTLGYSTRALERGAVISPPPPGRHHKVIPVDMDNPCCPWSDSLPHQDLHAMPPVQGVIGFSEVKEDLLEELLPHFHLLMVQLNFEVGGSSSSDSPETV